MNPSRNGQDSRRRSKPSLRLLIGINLFWLPLSFLSDGLTALVFPTDLGELAPGWKATILGLVTFTGLMLAMVIQPYAGAFSDLTRNVRGRRGTVALGLLLTLPCLGLYALGGLPAICVGYILVLVAASVSQAGLQGLIPDLVPPAHRGVASGVKGFMDLAGATLAFAVVGPLLASRGSGWAIGLMASLLLVAFIGTALIVAEPTRSTSEDSSEAKNAPRFQATPFRTALRTNPVFGWLVGSRFLFLLGAFTVGRFFLFFVEERLGVARADAAQQVGMLLGLLTLVSMVAGPAGGWAADRWGRIRIMEAGAVLSTVGILLLVTSGSRWQILLFGGLMSVGSAAFSAGNWAYTADVVPASEAGRYFGFANVGTMGGAAAAGLVGPLIDAGNRVDAGLGYDLALFGAALATLGGLFAVRRIRRLVRMSDPPVAALPDNQLPLDSIREHEHQ